MKLIKTAPQLTKYLNNLRTADNSLKIGFVPTMGALHKGHASLIEKSVSDNEITVCSIFVNPTQFGEKKDLETYPKPIDQDIQMLIDHNCDILFLPEVNEIYPEGYEQLVFDLDGLDFRIEGKQRPGHFQGVCNVLKRFFEIIKPDRAYFGQKDFQQAVVVKKLAKILGAPIDIVILPIAREDSGLAMSSRNQRLSAEGRTEAAFIYKALQGIQESYKEIGMKAAITQAREEIESHEGTVIEYLIAVDPESLEETVDITNNIAVLTVVRYEMVRLLDNLILAP